jgi:WD40 repeat protein
MSCAGDGTIRIWDPSMGDREVQQIQAHEGEVSA